MNRSIQTFLGPFLGFIIGSTLFVAVTTAVIVSFFPLTERLPNPAVDYRFGEALFWGSPLFLLGLLLSAGVALVGWPVVGFWIGGTASLTERAAHRRYSLLLGGGFGLVLGLLCNLTAFAPARLIQLWPLFLLALLLLQMAAGLATGYLLSVLLWRKAVAADSDPAQRSRASVVGQLGFLLLLPALVCVGSGWLVVGGWNTASTAASARPTPTAPSVLIALEALPVVANGLRPDDLLLLNSPDGVLGLQARQTAPLPWQSVADDLTAVLTTPYAQFDHHFYSADGRFADLSLLPHPPNGVALVSPNGRYLAYETAPRAEADADLGPLLHLYNLETGEDRFISRENSVLGWSLDSRYLYSRFRDRVFQYEPEADGDRVTGLPAVDPQGDGAPALLATAQGGLAWRVYSALYWRGAAEGAQTVRLGPTQINSPFVLSPDGHRLAWIRVLPPQLMLLPALPPAEATRPLLAQNQLYQLAWSPQGDRLVVWAENGCQPGQTTLPNPDACAGDLYLIALGEGGETAVTRLTDSGIGFQQITGLAWLQR
jgi:hypothetical protein